MVSWESAQAMELRTWTDSISVSPVLVYEELADAASLESFIQARGLTYRQAVDVGVGPLGIGWIAPFGHGTPDDLFGVDLLPRIAARTERSELDRFLERLQQRITYIQARAEDEVLPAASFELVVCDNVVDHSEARTNPCGVSKNHCARGRACLGRQRLL